jgi:CRISPR-associated protein Cmr4
MQALLYLFTRTPLHVGAGASVGAIDLPIQRERHTGFPVIPGSALKGVCADSSTEWTQIEERKTKGINKEGKVVDYTVKTGCRTKDGNWLFGEESDSALRAGALHFSEAKLLAFPIRSAKGGYAWITCPLLLSRFVRDGGMPADCLPAREPPDDAAIWNGTVIGFPQQNNTAEIVLEEYVFKRMRQNNANVALPGNLEATWRALLPDDQVWQHLPGRLVILSDGMLSYFVRAACQVMQRNRIDDATGTVVEGALFNQENVPVDTFFYATITARHAHFSGTPDDPEPKEKNASEALDKLDSHFRNKPVLQIGGDAGVGLGYCSVRASRLNNQPPQP